MHKQHPQTAYRKDAVLMGTIFENCDNGDNLSVIAYAMPQTGLGGRDETERLAEDRPARRQGQLRLTGCTSTPPLTGWAV